MRRFTFSIPLLFLLVPLVISSCENASSSSSGDSPYISTVYDYTYGPGQHASTIGTKEEQMAKFIGTSSSYVMLGGWGGFIEAGFDHDISNVTGYDFAVYTQPGTGNEPAAVFVKQDTNSNGYPDPEEPWYELAGSETGQTGYIQDYQVTYSQPAYDSSNITWTDNQGNTGVELVPGYPESSVSAGWWWDGYGSATEITLNGVKLPDSKYLNADDIWVDYDSLFTEGYAENYSGTDLDAALPFGSSYRSANRFDIDDAVDSSGNPVVLDSIRFIKIQSGIFLIAGMLNEVSPEISGAVDLSMIGN